MAHRNQSDQVAASPFEDFVATMTHEEAAFAARYHERMAEVFRAVATTRRLASKPANVPAPSPGSVRYSILQLMGKHPHRHFAFSDITRELQDRPPQVIGNELQRMLKRGEVLRPSKGIWLLSDTDGSTHDEIWVAEEMD